MNYFFGAPGAAPACGVFSPAHLISLGICIVGIVVALYFTRNISKKHLRVVTRVMAVVFTVLEIIKIIFKFVIEKPHVLGNGGIWQVDHWLPLAFCSLFIYVLWMCGFGKGIVYRLGASFICGGCFVGGLAFLILPLTSLQSYPIYHFLCLHSMLFHSCMIYMAGIYIKQSGYNVINKNNYKYYVAIVGGAGALSIIINVITYLVPGLNAANVMLLRHLPVGPEFPISFMYDFVGDIKFPFTFYTIGGLICYTVVPYFFMYFVVRVYRLIKKQILKSRAKKSEINKGNEEVKELDPQVR
ncbi:MAG: YwaF family protein [Clostridia bacterium]|nr:YwaF family protein [Clostridia bacterium]